jgi:hypothetical protein
LQIVQLVAFEQVKQSELQAGQDLVMVLAYVPGGHEE